MPTCDTTTAASPYKCIERQSWGWGGGSAVHSWGPRFLSDPAQQGFCFRPPSAPPLAVFSDRAACSAPTRLRSVEARGGNVAFRPHLPVIERDIKNIISLNVKVSVEKKKTMLEIYRYQTCTCKSTYKENLMQIISSLRFFFFKKP